MATKIQVQPTPNPNARKFIVDGVQFPGSTNYASTAEAAGDPCAHALFALPGVYNVFTAQNFVTVNKREDVRWEELEAEIQRVLTIHFADPA